MGLAGNTKTGVKKAIKRRAVKISLAIFVVVAILLGVLAVLERDWGRLRGFEFLGSPDLVVQKRRGTGRSATKATYYYYCYKADFNDVSAKADTGLSPMDIVNKQEITEQPRMSRYVLMGKGPGEWITVAIRDERKLSAYSTSKSSQSASPNRTRYSREKGWVSVAVTRTQLRSWPPWYLLYRLQMRLRGTAINRPPPGQDDAIVD
jgi:hypothetical protein